MLTALLVALAAPQVRAEPTRVTIAGVTAATGTVCVVKASPADEVPMLGEWHGNAFTPRVPFEAATTYRVTVPGVLSETFTLPAKRVVPGRVSAVHPACDTLPANLLRFYLHFDTEMMTGQGYAHFTLLDEKNEAVPAAFLKLDEELWSTDGRRLTLLFDPGRVKRELRPHLELGPVLREGKSYTLRVGKEFRTKENAPLTAEFTKPFRVAALNDAGLDPAKWTLTPPKPGTRDAVRLTFDRPMDHALRHNALRVEGAGKGVTLTPDDTQWQWKPEREWAAGRYEIVIRDTLEDVCGNRIGAAFDAAFGKIGARQLKEPTRLKFEVH